MFSLLFWSKLFCFFKLTIEMEGKHENFKVSSPENVPIYHKMVVISYFQQNDNRPVTSENI